MSDGGIGKEIQADSLFFAVDFDTVAEARKVFNILKEEGTVLEEPHKTDFATCMSAVKDKFGFQWFLMVELSESQ